MQECPKDVCELRDASARSVVANLAAVQAPSTHRKAGGMKQTKVSAARSVVANLAAVQANLTSRKAGGMKQTKVSAADPSIILGGYQAVNGMKQTKVSAVRSVVANLAAVQANLTSRKAGGMKQTKVSAADPSIILGGYQAVNGMKQTKVSAVRSVVANLAAVQANLTLRKAGGMKQTKVSAADPGGNSMDVYDFK